MKFFSKSQVALGEGYVTQYIVFEIKHLCSLIFYKWHTVDQVRFHSHAFAAIAILLRGMYKEQVLGADGVIRENTVNNRFIPRWLPHHYTHRILRSQPGTLTMVMTGPWSKYWWEHFGDSGTWVKYGWGRRKVLTTKIRPQLRD